MRKTTSAKSREHEWEVVVIRKKGERLGRVSAPDIKMAHDKAIEGERLSR